MYSVEDVLSELNALGSPENVAGMRRFGISGEIMYGVSVQDLRRLAKKIGVNHELAIELWESKVHEARILASMLDDARLVTESQINQWLVDLDSWDLCDQLCSNLLVNVQVARERIEAWISSEPEFVRRAGFALIVAISVKDKKADDATFLHYLNIVENAAPDDRNFVKKAVSWAIRQIGKRNLFLNGHAIKTAERLRISGERSNRWIASDAIRELSSPTVQKRLHEK